MTKEELEEVFHLPKEIKQIEERIDKIKNQSEMVSDVVQNGYKRHAVIYGVDIMRKYRIEKNENKLIEFKKKLVDKKQEIEDYIETVPFSEIRQIFRYRYLDNMNWVQVADAMNNEYKNKDRRTVYTEDSVRCKHDRYFEKN